VKYPAEPLKAESSKWPIPILESLSLELSAHVAARPVRDGVDALLTDLWGQLAPWTLERAMRDARTKVDGLDDGFRYHDLRHGSATTTLRTYAHLWPDKDESTRPRSIE
jgi:hypothetical protein